MKIELNLPALERLIGGDTELELSLKKQLVLEFARRHLHTIAEQENYQAVVQAVKDFVADHAKNAYAIENFIDGPWKFYGNRLLANIDKLVEERVQKAVDEATDRILSYQTRHWHNKANEVVNAALDRAVLCYLE